MIYVGPAVVLPEGSASAVLEVLVESGHARLRRVPGATQTLVPHPLVAAVPRPGGAPGPGWVSNTGPVPMQVTGTLLDRSLEDFRIEYAPELFVIRRQAVAFEIRFVVIYNQFVGRAGR